MPITEIVRSIAEATGTDDRGHPLTIQLVVDTDGRFGHDDQAQGAPRFWLRTKHGSEGPFDHEDEAVARALEAYGARF